LKIFSYSKGAFTFRSVWHNLALASLSNSIPSAISSKINPIDHISDFGFELKSAKPSSLLSKGFSNQEVAGW
jgi:hypothetical protein